MARGFYSVVQYCPDRFRAETVNVGLVLLCVDPHALRVKMTGKHDGVGKLFAISKQDLKNLKFSTDGLMSRIENSADELRTSEDLAAFAASRANDLLLTEPRLAKLVNFDEDFERLFAQLVETHSTAERAEASPAEVLPPKLGEVFYRLQQARKIWERITPIRTRSSMAERRRCRCGTRTIRSTWRRSRSKHNAFLKQLGLPPLP